MKAFLLLLLFSFSFATESLANSIPESAQKDILRLESLEFQYWNEKDWDNYMMTCHELLMNYEQYLSDDEKVRWNTKLGNSFLELGSNNLAVESFKKALSVARKKEKGVDFVHSQLGSAYLRLGNYDDAIREYQAAMSYAQNEDEKIKHLNSLGFCYFRKGDYSKAEERYNKALQIFETSDEDSIQYYLLQSNLGTLDISKGDYQKGLSRLESLAKVNFTSSEDWFRVEIFTKLARYFVSVDDCQNSKSSLDVLEKLLSLDTDVEAQVSYYDLRLKQSIICGEQPESRKYAELLSESHDKRNKLDNKRLAIIERLEQKDINKQLELMSENLDLKEKDEKRYVQVIVMLILLTLFIVVFFALRLMRNKKEQKKKEHLLELKEQLIAEEERNHALKREMSERDLNGKRQEVKNLMQSISNDVILVDELTQRLEVIHEYDSGFKKGIAGVLQFLKSHSKHQVIDELIEKNIEILGVNFKDRMIAEYPNLTEMEMQLILFIRIGLSNKEIALIRNVEPGSVRMFKYRLKTKLNLSKEDSVSGFIQNF